MNHDSALICPVCDKRAQIKFFDETLKVWVYKHPRNLRGGRFDKSETIYHESSK